MPTRRKRPTLPYSLRHIQGDSYKVTVSHGTNPDGSRRRHYTTVHAPTETQAHLLAATYTTELLTRAAAPARAPGGPTVADWCATWLCEYVERHLAPGTRQSYRHIIAHRIIPALGHIRLEKLTPKHVTIWLAMLDEPGNRLDGKTGARLSGASRMRAYRVLTSLLQEAVYRHMLPSNPAKGARPPRTEPREARHYQAEDVHALLAALEDSPADWRAWILLALASGMRRGELIALQWSDIDFAAGTVSVTRSAVAAVGHVHEIKAPKSQSGVRRIHLPAIALDALRLWRSQQHAQIQAIRDGSDTRRKWADDGDHIITTSGGRWMTPDGLSRAWSRWIAAHHLPAISLHGLRHTAASLLIAAGIPARTVSGVLGHAQTSTTMNIYSHLIHESAVAAADAMGAALARNGGQSG